MTMKIENYFTIDEITSARLMGAIVTTMSFNRHQLSFPDRESYTKWLKLQKLSHPQLWINSFSLHSAKPSLVAI